MHEVDVHGIDVAMPEVAFSNVVDLDMSDSL